MFVKKLLSFALAMTLLVSSFGGFAVLAEDGVEVAEAVVETDVATVELAAEAARNAAGIKKGTTSGTLESGNITWTLSKSGMLTLEGEGPMDDFDPDTAPWSEQKQYVKFIYISDGITTVGNYAFYDLTKAGSAYIPQSLESIGTGAFEKCSSIKEFELPEGLLSIGEGAFRDCLKVKEFNIPASVEVIGESAFANCDKLKDINVDYGNVNYTSAEGVLFDCSMEKLIAYPGHNQNKRYDIPYGVTEISSFAFDGCHNLSDITFPDTLVKIGGGAFNECDGLQFIEIPASVTDIAQSAFLYGMSALEEINVVEENEAYSSLNGVLYNKTKTKLISFPAMNHLAVEEGKYTLPASVRVIGQEAFYECQNITDLYIHIGVKEFEMAAFMQFDSLTDIWYDGSKVNWEMIKKGEHNEKLDEVEIHFVEKTYPSFNAVKGSHYSISQFVDFGGNEELKESAEYSSSNPDVAMIDGDTMIAVAEGDAVITAVVYNDGNLFAVETRVIVESEDSSDDYDLTPADGYFELDEGDVWDARQNIRESGHEQSQLITSNNEWRRLVWISSDEDVIKVDGGMFTAVGGGTAEVVAIYRKTYVLRIPVKVNGKYTPEEYFRFSDGVIRGYTGPDDIVKIPPTIGGQIVHTIGANAFQSKSHIKKIVLPETVTKINNYAFYYCTSLTDIALREGLQSIGAYAFYGCRSLVKIKIPSTITSTGSNLFQNCTKLNTVEYAAGTTYIDGYAVKGSSAKKVILPSTVREIAPSAFASTKIESITIPKNVEKIGDRAFYNCYRLKKVTFQSGSKLKKIGESVFAYSGLTSMTLPDGITSIGYEAFRECDYLTKIVIPDTVTYMDNMVFYYCIALTDVKLSESLTTIPYGTFYNCEALTTIDIPQSVKKIGGCAFFDCNKLITVNMGTNVETLEYQAFAYCSNLRNIDLSGNLQTIGNNAFSDCTSLDGIKLGSSLKTLGYSVFIRCSALTSIVIPDSVTSMGPYMFQYCTKLENAELGKGLTHLPYNTFYGCYELKSIVIPDNIAYIGHYAFQYCYDLTDVNIGTGVQYIGEKAFAYCDSLDSINIPANVKKIYNEAFYYCDRLANVNLENGVTSIGSYAFYWCYDLDSISLPDSVTQLGSYAFYYCSDLESVELSANLGAVPDYAFYRCSSLDSIAIPDSVTSIGRYAFAYCTSLNDITMGKNVSYVGYNAFYMCPYNPGDALDRDQTSFTTEDSTNMGYIPLKIEYKFKDNVAVSNKYVVVTMPATTFLVSGSMKLDGMPYSDYTEAQGNGLYANKTVTIQIPDSSNDGVIDFCVKSTEYATISLYADIEYTSMMGSNSYRIGYLNCSMPEITISAPAMTSKTDIVVEGMTAPGRSVALYIDDVYTATVNATSTGAFNKTLYINNPKNHRTYTIKAEVITNNGSKKTAEAKVQYEADTPNLEGLVLYYGRNGERKNAYDLFNNRYEQQYSYYSGGRYYYEYRWTNPIKYIQWGSASSYHYSGQYYSYYFTVDVSNRAEVDKVYVVSTRDGEKSYLEAKWDESIGKYKTNGYFDGDWGYVPNNITVEYTKVIDDVQVTLDDILNYMDVEDETLVPSITDYTSTSYSAEIAVSRLLKNLFGDRIDISTEVLDVDYSQISNDELFADKQNYYAFPITDNGNNLVLSFDLTDSEKAQVYLHDLLNNKQVAYTMTFTSIGADGSESNLVIADILDKIDAYAGRLLNAYNLNMDTDKLIDDLGKTALEEADLMMLTEKAQQLDIKKKMFVLASMVISAANMNNISAPSDILDLIMAAINKDLKFFGDLKLLITYRIGNEYKIRWKIDPSGYVYEGVTDNRLQGVTTTLYCIANEDIPKNDAGEYDFASIDEAKVSVWDASEYDQQNPLVTDENGRYRWDVPDGMHWRVEYKKDGYDTAYSQWLPVPPVQTDVNVGLVSHAQPKVEDIRLTPEYLRVSFDKYMKPETVSDVVVGGVTLKAKYDTAKTDLAGNVYAKDFVFELGTSLALDTQYEVTVANAKSYADAVMEAYASTLAVTMESELTVSDIAVDGTNISFNYINDTGKEMNFKAMCAVYGVNGEMVDMKVVEVENLGNLTTNSKMFEFEKDWDTYKIYAWSTDSMLKSVMRVYNGAK